MLCCCHCLEGFAVVTLPEWQGNMLDGMRPRAHEEPGASLVLTEHPMSLCQFPCVSFGWRQCPLEGM